ncbi:hypothetical protein [Pararhizobium sp. A13]|uniref:hypothetical protein n=1 Tax=Pararhizobium sp. A13 TaxID=3133975 RepID=UPI00311B20CD
MELTDGLGIAGFQAHANSSLNHFAFLLEHDPRSLKREPHESQIALTHFATPFKGAEGHSANRGTVGQLALGPIKESSGSATLSWFYQCNLLFSKVWY